MRATRRASNLRKEVRGDSGQGQAVGGPAAGPQTCSDPGELDHSQLEPFALVSRLAKEQNTSSTSHFSDAQKAFDRVQDGEVNRTRFAGRLFRLSYAAIAGSSSMTQYGSSALAGGMFLKSSRSRRWWLNRTTHSRVANSTASKLRHGPRRWMTSALN